ncbi:ABC transporter permease [candidate division KSB1 bacterium]
MTSDKRHPSIEKLIRLLFPDTGETKLGDFIEVYYQILTEYGRIRAFLWFLRFVIISAPSLLYSKIYRSAVMFKNYFKIALRNISNHKVYSFINITGLSIGIACCILILLYVQYELSYDKYHENADNIYRVSREWWNSDGSTSLHLGQVAPSGGYHLKQDFPEILEMVRFVNIGGMKVTYKDKTFVENDIYGADEGTFRMFSWKLLKGDPKTALSQPNSGVITESIAEKYFGDEDPMNKVLKCSVRGFNLDFIITGVMEDTPHNSHAHFELFYSMETVGNAFAAMYGQENFMTRNWSSNNWATYVLLPDGYNVNNLEDQMHEFMQEKMNSPGIRTTLHFWKLTDIHLHSNLDSEIEANSDIKYIYIFSAVAFFILLIACFNFMNLSTARSSLRAKEVGMRKVAGAFRKQLIVQFIGESLLMAFFSLILASILVIALLPAINGFVNLPLKFNVFQNFTIASGLMLIIVFIGIVSGSYPAFFLSSFKPVSVLKGERTAHSKSSFFRTILVVTQFAISIILIISMGIVMDQLDYIRNKRLGFDKEHLVTFGMPTFMSQRVETVKIQLLENSNILSVTASTRIPTGRLLDSAGGRIASGDSLAPIQFRLADIPCDHDYFKTFGVEIATGRDFSEEFTTDKQEAFIINETAASRFGWEDPSEALDKSIQYSFIDRNTPRRGKIIGVVKDFHFESLHQPIVPIIFYYNESRFRAMTVKIRSTDISSSIDHMEGIWNNYNPDIPFNYSFVDERFDRLYQYEEKLSRVFGSFAALAVIIACLGLFGLASFTAERRTKEIGIRKALGASVPGMVSLLSKEFTRLVILSNIIAWPVAYYMMDRWLQSFAYRADMSIITYFISAFLALLIALLTIGFQATRSAVTNPVNSLRYE